MKPYMLKFIALLLIFTKCFFSCIDKEEHDKIPFIQIGKGSLYKYTEDERVFPKQNRIFSSQDEWERFIITINAYNSEVTDQFHETKIDFNKYQIIAVIDEVHWGGAWNIEIGSVIDYSDRIVVTVFVKNNSNGDASPQVASQPYHIVKIPQSTTRIEFKLINN